jgi:hypothetical protein
VITPTDLTVFEDAKIPLTFPSTNINTSIVIRKHPVVLTVNVTDSFGMAISKFKMVFNYTSFSKWTELNFSGQVTIS